jgi:hypothetical protein
MKHLKELQNHKWLVTHYLDPSSKLNKLLEGLSPIEDV